MSTGSHWRDRARPIIQSVLSAWNGVDEKELRKALHEAYPFGERKMYPYKVWLSEIRVQTKKTKRLWNKKAQPVDERQETMF